MSTKTLIRTPLLAGLAGLLACLNPFFAQAEDWQEGVHYALLPVPVDTQTPEQIEIVEVFSYACVHCYTFDPLLDEWLAGLPDDVGFRRIPATFNKTWGLLAQVFYTAQVLGVREAMHMPIFRAIHEPEEALDLRKQEFLEQLFREIGQVDPADFNNAFGSFSVRSRVQQADAHGRAYRISGVPSLIVNGKYRVDGTMAGGNANMLKIVEYLVAQERAAAGSHVADGAQ
ncbi:MAG: thiol:disulfide interchange protein DsbA/DsbL [Gammaproteobacteria bacterium]|nr:thiol:disulfide interchange protein DsbA/DsbL [Gammaproteobacteria bacterium]